jgi:hypothetical protein
MFPFNRKITTSTRLIIIVNHDGFVDRPEIIIKTQGAKTVGEHSL